MLRNLLGCWNYGVAASMNDCFREGRSTPLFGEIILEKLSLQSARPKLLSVESMFQGVAHQFGAAVCSRFAEEATDILFDVADARVEATGNFLVH